LIHAVSQNEPTSVTASTSKPLPILIGSLMDAATDVGSSGLRHGSTLGGRTPALIPPDDFILAPLRIASLPKAERISISKAPSTRDGLSVDCSPWCRND